MFAFVLICLIVSVVAFAAATFGASGGKVNLLALGLLAFALAQAAPLVARLS